MGTNEELVEQFRSSMKQQFEMVYFGFETTFSGWK
jgi:hypothetical protein